MLGYYLDLARRSLRRNPALTALMIVAIAFGVGASMTTLTVLHVLSADPIPGKSRQLYNVQLDPYKASNFTPGEEPPDQLTRHDAETLVRAKKATRQIVMTGGGAAIDPQRPGLDPFQIDGRWTSGDFFAMFDVPFLHGGGWTQADDDNAARVTVIAKSLAEKAFGTTDVVGKTLQVENNPLRVVGVIEDWMPAPRFYDFNVGAFGDREQIYVPWSTSRVLKLGHNGSTNCWDQTSDSEAENAPCLWTQMWVELGTADQAAAYRNYLVSYSEDQLRAGRFQRPPNVRLRNVIEWLDYKEVVPNDAKLQTWVALGFLLVCLINTVGLLLTKFLRRSMEIGVRRALGASKRSIFVQLLIESGMIGVAGGTIGLGLALLGLWAVRHQPTDYAKLAQIDVSMLVGTLLLAIVSSLLAGLLPAWRGCQVTPAIQLKSH